MADPFAMNDGSDDGFEAVSKSDFLVPEQQADSTVSDSQHDDELASKVDVDFLSGQLTTDDKSNLDTAKDFGIEGEHGLVSDINNDLPSMGDIDDDHQFNAAQQQEREQLSSSAATSSPQDLLLDFGGNFMASDPAPSQDMMSDDLTPLAPEENAFADQFTREATPPPSPPPSPVREPVMEPEPKPDPVESKPVIPSAPSADSTTPASDNRPVKMPKATTISAPTRSAPNRASGLSLTMCLPYFGV